MEKVGDGDVALSLLFTPESSDKSHSSRRFFLSSYNSCELGVFLHEDPLEFELSDERCELLDVVGEIGRLTLVSEDFAGEEGVRIALLLVSVVLHVVALAEGVEDFLMNSSISRKASHSIIYIRN